MDELAISQRLEEFILSEIASDPPEAMHGKFAIHSFIIRMWLEQSEEKPRHGIWRGRITHIPSNEYQYFTDTKNILSFIKSHLNE